MNKLFLFYIVLKHKRNHLGADRTRLETRKHYLEQEKAGKIHQNEKTKNKIEACKKMHTAYSLKVWFIRYWLAKNNKPIPDIPDEPCPPKHVVLHHAEEGDGHSPIPNGIKGLIHNYEESDRKFTNAQYIGCYGSGNKVRALCLKRFGTVCRTPDGCKVTSISCHS